MKPLKTIEIQADKKLLVLIGILIVLIVIAFNLAEFLGILAIILSIYVLLYICCSLNGKIEIYEEYLKVFPSYLNDKYKRSLWDKKVKIPWQDIYFVSSNKKEALIGIPYVENLITEINIYSYNMVKIAQIDVSIFADDDYWNQIKLAFTSREISIDGEKLLNSTSSNKENAQETTSINYGRENMNLNKTNNNINILSESQPMHTSDDNQKVSTSRRRHIINSSKEIKIKSSINQKETKGRRLEL